MNQFSVNLKRLPISPLIAIYVYLFFNLAQLLQLQTPLFRPMLSVLDNVYVYSFIRVTFRLLCRFFAKKMSRPLLIFMTLPLVMNAQTNAPHQFYLFIIFTTITSLFAGLSVCQYLFFKKDVWLIFYTLYLLGMSLYFCYLTCGHENLSHSFSWMIKYEENLKGTINFFPYAMYFLFGKYILNFEQTNQKADKIVDKLVIGLFAYFALDLFFLKGRGFDIAATVLAVFAIYLVKQVYNRKDKLAVYILRGTVCYLIGAVISLGLQSLKISPTSWYFEPLLYDGLGTLLDVIFFFAAFIYRFKILQKEKITIQLQTKFEREQHRAEQRREAAEIAQLKAERKLMDMKTERDAAEIAQLKVEQALIKAHYIDKQKEIIRATRVELRQTLHDFVNTTLSAIKIQAGRLKENNNIDELKEGYEIVEKTSSHVLEKMDGLIILLEDKPAIDAFEQIAINNKRLVFPENTIGFKFHRNAALEGKRIRLDKTACIEATIVEGIGNAAKYSECSKIDIHVFLKKENVRAEIHFVVQDNGKGFDIEKVKFEKRVSGGRGLENLKARAKELGGTFHVDSNDSGTTLLLILPYDENEL